MLGYRGFEVEKLLGHLRDLDLQSFTAFYDRDPRTLTVDHVEEILGETQTYIYQYLYDHHRRGLRSNLTTIIRKDETYCLVGFAEPISEDLTKRTGKGDLEIYFDLIRQFDLTEAIFITATPLSPDAASQLRSLNLNIQHFTDDEFDFNPLDHVYNSKARLLDAKEAEAFLQRNNLTRGVMPRVPANEPVAKYLGARPDDIIEYQRESFIPETLLDLEVFHRVVRRAVEKKKAPRKP